MSTAKRLKMYLEYKKIAVFRAENECGLSSSSLSKALPNKEKGIVGKSIGSDNLEKILSTYTDLSANWLLRGVGSMILDDKNQTGGESNKYFILCKLILENKQRENELYSELARLMSKD